MKTRHMVGSLLVGGVIASLALATPASGDTGDNVLVWPYVGDGTPALTDTGDELDTNSGPTDSVHPESSITELMEAFGATPDEAATVASVTLSRSAPSSVEVPDALTNADPVRIERGTNAALAAEVHVYDDGSLALSVAQTDSITPTDSTVIAFDSATVDFVRISDALNLRSPDADATESSLTSEAMDIALLDVPTGCDSLPNSGGWIRRANCYVYDSVHAPPLNGVAASAYFNYSVKSQAGRMDSIRRNDSNCAGGFSSSQAYVDRRHNSGTLPARGLHEVDCNWGVFSSTHVQQVLVLGTAWSSMN